MRHYEVVLIIYPDNSNQISTVINHYIAMINESGGVVHRMENWGCRSLAYVIKKRNKAYYVLLNIEVSKSVLNNLMSDLKFNNMILRNIIIRMTHAVTVPSPMLSIKENNTVCL